MSDSVNAISARFTPNADGFEVTDPGTTAVAYGGSDPQRLAAIAAFGCLACGSREGTGHGPAEARVVSIDNERLVLDTGPLQLEFERTGPARPAVL
jgi:hypothetical protein